MTSVPCFFFHSRLACLHQFAWAFLNQQEWGSSHKGGVYKDDCRFSPNSLMKQKVSAVVGTLLTAVASTDIEVRRLHILTCSSLSNTSGKYLSTANCRLFVMLHQTVSQEDSPSLKKLEQCTVNSLVPDGFNSNRLEVQIWAAKETWDPKKLWSW